MDTLLQVNDIFKLKIANLLSAMFYQRFILKEQNIFSESPTKFKQNVLLELIFFSDKEILFIGLCD